LQRAIPAEIRKFPKLTAGDPYEFISWDTDEDGGGAILRYWFWDRTRTKRNRKRVFVREMAALLANAGSADAIARQEFDILCPRTRGDGSCGFAVVLGILRHYGVVRAGSDGVYPTIDKASMAGLLRGEKRS
jgi:hypothetical protein